MSTVSCAFFFFFPPSCSLTNTEGSLSASQVYSPRILLVSDAALCNCSSEDRTAATINYSTRTSMPQAALRNRPVCHQCIFFQTRILALPEVEICPLQTPTDG